MTYKDIFKQVSQITGIDKDVVKEAYLSSWLFIKNKIESFPLKEDISVEDFNKLRTSFNIPSIGKLYSDYDKLKFLQNKYKVAKEEYAKDKED